MLQEGEVCQKAISGYTLPVLKCGCSQGADITVDILFFISSCGEVLAEGTIAKRKLILPSAARAATKFSKLMEAARCQPSVLDGQLLNNHPEHSFDFRQVVRQNFFAECKEVTDRESILPVPLDTE
jgi:hypothetical protein